MITKRFFLLLTFLSSGTSFSSPTVTLENTDLPYKKSIRIEESSKPLKRILFTIQKSKSEKISKYSVRLDENGVYSDFLYLRDGSGDYTVFLYEKTNILSEMFDHFETLNLSLQDKTEWNEYLLPSGMIESDREDIIELGKEIVGTEKDPYQIAKKVYEWNSKNIHYDVESFLKNTVVNISARETLQKKRGVCLDMSYLVAAILRSLSIPTKVVQGYASNPILEENRNIILNSSTPEHYSNHAWLEFYANGRWVLMDPTWGAGGIDPRTNQYTSRVNWAWFDSKKEEFEKTHLDLGELFLSLPGPTNSLLQ